MSTFGSEDEYTAGSGAVEIAFGIHFHAVWHLGSLHIATVILAMGGRQKCLKLHPQNSLRGEVKRAERLFGGNISVR
jgi:hypothetical protein